MSLLILYLNFLIAYFISNFISSFPFLLKKTLILYLDIDFVSFHKAFHTSVNCIIKYVMNCIYLTFNHRSILQLNFSCEV